MKAKQNKYTATILQALKPRQVEKIKKAYLLTESELVFILSLKLRNAKNTNVLLQKLVSN